MAQELYMKFEYQQLIDQNSDPTFVTLALLKLNEASATISLGPLSSRPQSERFETAKSTLKDQGTDFGKLASALLSYFTEADAELQLKSCPLPEARYYQGLILYEKELYDSAALQLEAASGLSPAQEVNRICMLALCHYQLGLWVKAAKKLEEAKENSLAYAILARLALQRGDKQGAETWFNAALKLNPNCLYAKLFRALSQSKHEEAVKVLEGAEQNPRVRFAIVKLLMEQVPTKPENGELEGLPRGPLIKKALSVFEECKKPWPNHNFIQAQLLLFSNQTQLASPLFDSCIKENWKQGEATYYNALIAYGNMMYEEAISLFSKAAELKVRTDSCIFWKATSLYQMGEYEKAQKELEIGAETAQKQVLLAKIMNKKGDSQSAMNWINQAQKTNSNSLYVKVVKAQFTKKTQEAVSALELALKENSDNLAIKRELIESYLQVAQEKIQVSWGEYAAKPKGIEIQKSSELFKDFQAGTPNRWTIYHSALFNYYSDEFEKAFKEFDELVKLNYKTAYARFYQGSIRMEQLKHRAAIDHFLQAMAIEPPFELVEQCRFQIAVIHTEMYQPDKAIKLLEEAKQGCQYYVLLAKALLLKGNAQQAEVWLNESLKINSNCLYSKILKAQIANNQEEVGKLLDSAMKSDQENYVLAWARGKVLNRQSKFAEAIPFLDKAVQKRYLPAFASKAKSLRALKKYEEALEVIKQGLSICQNYPPLLVVQAGILMDQEKYDESVNVCKSCIQENSLIEMAYLNQALSLQKQGKFEEAQKSYDEMLKVNKYNIKGYVGKADIAKQQGDDSTMLECIQTLHDIVARKSKEIKVNPKVMKNAEDLYTLHSEVERKGQFIESQAGEQAKLELAKIKEQKEAITAQKMIQILQPHRQTPQAHSIEEVLKRLDQLTKEVEKLNSQNAKLQQENLIQSAQIEEMQQENKEQWETLRNSGAFDKAKIQEWYNQNQGTEKHNYAVAFYWTLLSHIDAYRAANTGALATSTGHTEDPDEKKFVSYVKDGVSFGKKLTSYVPYLGNICQMIDDVTDSVYSQIKSIRYANRIRSICKIVYENGTTEIAENLSLVLAKAAQEIADKKNFSDLKGKKPKENLHFFAFAKKYFDDKIKEVKQHVYGKEITLYESKGGTEALKDVITVIAYLTIEFAEVIKKAKKVPLNQQIAEIIIGEKEDELLKNARPVQDGHVQPFNPNFDAEKDMNKKEIERRDQKGQGEGGCCVLQ